MNMRRRPKSVGSAGAEHEQAAEGERLGVLDSGQLVKITARWRAKTACVSLFMPLHKGLDRTPLVMASYGPRRPRLRKITVSIGTLNLCAAPIAPTIEPTRTIANAVDVILQTATSRFNPPH